MVLKNSRKAQFKIQQMAFMIIFVFIFFVLVGLFFLQMNLMNIRSSAAQLEREQAIMGLLSWAELPELSCSDTRSGCIDKDKVFALSDQNLSILYRNFWPVASIRIYLIDTNLTEEVRCTSSNSRNCNYFNVFDSGQQQTQLQGTYVSLCETVRRENQAFRECEIAILSIGQRIRS